MIKSILALRVKDNCSIKIEIDFQEPFFLLYDLNKDIRKNEK